ncbi:MAG: dTDP-4-dehydrorhamnose reductase, partial [Phycisphaerae bacterium]|nr:dTDP-4-dehydrorhamnose reductase [Phycisphaerae bacterium]
MKILVTGANGQVGSELIRRGNTRGFQMLASDVSDLDISNQDAVNRYIENCKPDILINAAAYTAVDKAESEEELAYAINRDGAAYLAQACSKLDIPLFHISTDYVFDGTKDGAYVETDTPNPQSVYGKSKLEGDLVIESTIENHIILRVSWVFGACGNNFVKTMIRLGSKKEELKIVADQQGGPTWAGAIASTLLDIAKRYDEGNLIQWGTYHYSSQPTTTWLEFADTIFGQAADLGMMEKRPKIDPICTH